MIIAVYLCYMVKYSMQVNHAMFSLPGMSFDIWKIKSSVFCRVTVRKHVHWSNSKEMQMLNDCFQLQYATKYSTWSDHVYIGRTSMYEVYF